jgi:hypothetical protein
MSEKARTGMIAFGIAALLYLVGFGALLLLHRPTDAPTARPSVPEPAAAKASESTPAKSPAAPAGTALTRDEARRRFLGATADQVRAALGAPDCIIPPRRVELDPNGSAIQFRLQWEYHGPTARCAFQFDDSNRVAEVTDSAS